MNCEYVDILQSPPFSHVHAEYTQQYFSVSGLPVVIDVERCGTIISRSGEKLGEYDFFFELFTEPMMEQVYDLLEKIDEALAPLGCKYTITTK